MRLDVVIQFVCSPFFKNVNCAEASTNGAKHKFDSFGGLVCELRQICIFHSWWAFYSFVFVFFEFVS